MPNHVMIDLETMSTRFDAAILSIGACVFDLPQNKITDEFYVKLNMQSAKSSGHVCPDTLDWWEKQGLEAREEAFRDEGNDLVDFHTALTQLTQWLPPNPVVWGNGSTFDISILGYHYPWMCESAPWNFRNVRDMRTIAAFNLTNPKSIPPQGPAHHALSDAKWQALFVMDSLNWLSEFGLIDLSEY